MPKVTPNAARTCVVALVIAAASCTQRAARFETTSVAPSGKPETPPPVVAALPGWRQKPHSDGPLVLREAPRLAAAEELVERFFEALGRGDADSLTETMSSHAIHVTSSNQRMNARQYWRNRLREIDFAGFGDKPMYRSSSLRYRRGSDEGDDAKLEHDELLLEVPLLATHLDGVRVLAPRIDFIIAAEVEGTRISRVTEHGTRP